MRNVVQYLRSRGHGQLAAELATAGNDEVRELAHRIRDKLPEVDRREQKILDIMDLWIEKGVVSKRGLKIAFTKYLAACKEAIVFNIPSNLRPGERKHIEEWRTFVEQTSLLNTEKELKELSKLLDSSIATHEYAEKFKSTFVHRAGGFGKEIRETALPNIGVFNVMDEKTKIGRFTVIDDYGTPEVRFEKWVGIIHRTESILKKSGLDYLCYGNLVLQDMTDAWGMYYAKGDYVALNISDSRPTNEGAMLYTLIHELGHRLWYKFMDAGHRQQFAAPWIEQDELVKHTFESMHEVLTVPVKEREEGFELAWKSTYDIKKFEKWINESPEKKIRWLRWLSWTLANASFAFAEGGALKTEAFKWVHDRLTRLRENLGKARQAGEKDTEEDILDTLKKYQESQYTEWLEEKPNAIVRLDDVKRAFEPGTGKLIQTPITNLILDVLKVRPIKPSVSDYGNQSREEDFAESFAAVLLGTAKEHSVKVRVQRALPKGTVAKVEPEQSVADFLRENGYSALAANLDPSA